MKRASVSLSLLSTIVAVAVACPVEAKCPELLSPGGREVFSATQDTSPTFSWEAVAGAARVDLLVFGLPAGFPPPTDASVMTALAALEPAVWVPLPGGASSWTLPAEWRLDAGGRYAWVLRAVGEDGSEQWSSPSFFDVLAAPSTADVRHAMEVLSQYLQSQPRTAGASPPAARQPMKIVMRTTAPPDARAPVIPAGPTAIKGDVGGTSGATYGVMGVSHSPDGAGVVGVNLGGGALVMGYAGDTLLFTVGGDGTVRANTFLPACDAPTLVFPDNDEDTYGNSVLGVRACTPPAGYVTTEGDCDDGDPAVNPAGAEVCDGLDNNCDDEVDNVDGTGLPCNTGLPGMCADGVTACDLDFHISCQQVFWPSEEMCDGQDNDCDGLVDEDFPVGQACDTGELGACSTGVYECSWEEGVQCQQTAWPEQESCDNVDNDCNGVVDDNLQQPCYDGPPGTEGVGACHGGEETCDAGAWGVCVGQVLPEPEACNNIDDDCDGQTDEGNPGGGACDGPDSDLCAEGTLSCTAGELTCSDATGNLVDLCNGADDDCDPASADGSEDPQSGAACDGPDSDLCAEGTLSCVAGELTCSDVTANLVDLCNGVDDDCDPASADGSEDPQSGAACDGPDSDLCAEGTLSCVAGTPTCSDATGNLVDLCNGTDDDCDPASADGSEDPQSGAACDGLDADLCTDDYAVCVVGGFACADTPNSYVEVCDGIDNDCDLQVDEGCPGSSCSQNSDCLGDNCECADTTCSQRKCSTAECFCMYDAEGNGTCDGFIMPGFDDANDSCGASTCNGVGGCS